MRKKRLLLGIVVSLMMVTTGCSSVTTVASSQGTAGQAADSGTIQIIYTSDVHFGLKKDSFQGSKNVDSDVVNKAMVKKMNLMPTLTLPSDGGVNADKKIGAVDATVVTGDIANREEGKEGSAIQDAAASWNQFKTDFIDGLTLTDKNNQKSPIYLTPGNHDISNAIGFTKPMYPDKDPTSFIEIYNRMMKPSTPLTKDNFDYSKDKLHYSKDIGGIHMEFLNIWPDSEERAWMEKDLASVSVNTPVIIFTHVPPVAEAKLFTNPNGSHDINGTDKFENEIVDQLADGNTVGSSDTIEQDALAAFIKKHPNIVAYFHGHDNKNEFYDWKGTKSNTVNLHTFRVDSPMKGDVSAKDETKLSYQFIDIDPKAKKMTVRECLYDADPSNPNAPISWGASETIDLMPGESN
ncbi:metallophosphoesterase [Clostridium sp.]|uniref:metallophosphoesterase family protein n=1 Tax=Clostridium sp. TaxID=1506 RepID=UPI00261DCD0D|nr:metallophosphoesterase [Clostridium sp.]